MGTPMEFLYYMCIYYNNMVNIWLQNNTCTKDRFQELKMCLYAYVHIWGDVGGRRCKGP